MSVRHPPFIELRPAGSADEAFLQDLESRARGAQLAQAGLPAPLVAMQVRARWSAYAAAWSTEGRRIVIADGTPLGTVWLGDAGDAVVVVDLVVAPEHQGQGVGTAVLQRVAREAAPRPLRLSVAENNPAARRLYLAAGFRQTGEMPGYLQMSRAGIPGGPE